MKRAWRQAICRGPIVACALAVAFAAAGCSGNPIVGKWKIGKREKEMEATYVDELTTNIRPITGASQIEFRKDSIAVTGGPKDHLIENVQYSVQELPGGAVDVRILQPRPGDTSRDIDVLHIDASGNNAQLESPTELIDLARDSD
jgi:archaellin